MSDQNKTQNNEQEEYEAEIYTLCDEDGNEIEFEVIGNATLNDTEYYAMIPYDENKNADEISEYVILKIVVDENGERNFVTLDDDDEFDSVADYFDDMFSEEIDYDQK